MDRTRVGRSLSKSRKLFEDFHEAEPNRMVKINMPELPETAMLLGEIVEIVYRPLRPSKRAGADFQHTFGDTGLRMLKEKPWLLVSPDGKNLIIYRYKSSMHFTDRGIIG